MFRMLVLTLGWLWLMSASAASNQNLPELGDHTSGIISLDQERELGQEFLRALRAQAPLVPDPVLQEYVEHLIFRLALHSELTDRRLEVVLIDSDALNAFAAPGGIVGVHDGIFLYAESEDELSAILAHELAHLSQRHYARQADAGRSASMASIAGLLTGLVLIAAGGGSDAGMAAITAGQAATQSEMLRYSRGRESEADRVGIRTLVDAKMNPRAMAGMFERLDRASRFQGSDIPEFLLTHPVTRDRIADSYNQIRQYQVEQEYPTSIDYQMMKARVTVRSSKTVGDAIRRMEDGLNDPDPIKRAANQYGLVLALTEGFQLDKAQRQLNSLKQQYPGKIALTIAEAKLQVRADRFENANDILEAALRIAPNNYPLTMTYADTLLKAGRAAEAEKILSAMTLQRPDDVALWYLLAEAYGLANNIVGVHQARAEYFVLVGNLDQAIKQLGYAMPLVRGNFQQTARIQTRMEEIFDMRQKRKRRSS